MLPCLLATKADCQLLFLFLCSFSVVLLTMPFAGEALAVADGVILLRAFSVYVLLLAVNGIAECFVTAVRNNMFFASSHFIILFLI